MKRFAEHEHTIKKDPPTRSGYYVLVSGNGPDDKRVFYYDLNTNGFYVTDDYMPGHSHRLDYRISRGEYAFTPEIANKYGWRTWVDDRNTDFDLEG